MATARDSTSERWGRRNAYAGSAGEAVQDDQRRTSTETDRVDRYEWEVESGEDEVDIEPDAYSWVDPSVVGTEQLGSSVSTAYNAGLSSTSRYSRRERLLLSLGDSLQHLGCRVLG